MMAGSILLADDEEKILKTLGRALRDDGHEVITASNAREATRLLSERSIDLLVIDFLMPDRTGLDVIREFFAGTERVTAAYVTRAAETWLNPEAAYRVVVSPAETVAKP